MQITDWIMVVITAVYVIATIFISNSNRKSAKAAEEAVAESKKQFKESIELQKQHNIDSVRPAVSIDFESSHGIESFSGRVTLTNHGLGPAIIQSLRFFKGEREYINTNHYCTLYDLTNFRIEETQQDLAVMKAFRRFYTKEFRYDKNNFDYLAVGEKLVLMEFEAQNRPEAEMIGTIFHGVKMQLTYTDIFESNEWKAVSRLSYFKPDWINKRKVSRLQS